LADGAAAENAVAVIVAQTNNAASFAKRCDHRIAISPYKPGARLFGATRYFSFFE
jgi:hypothetical protein